MNKDVIYIDVDDDITAIIGKVKSSKERIVALVPPKRIGALQSAVNLRLIDRTAKSNDKRLVLITNNQALIALSAAAKIPVAKNLQSKPEIAEIAALEIDDGDDVIDGAQLPVGDHARSGDEVVQTEPKKITVNKSPDDIVSVIDEDKPVRPVSKKPAAKVPDFNKFRKKLFLIIVGVLALIGFLVWAIWFAPQATVVITAKTSSLSVDDIINLSTNATTSLEEKRLRVVTQTEERELSASVTPTGEKEVGESAKGTMTIRNCDTTNPFTLPSGTEFTSGSRTFVSTSAVSVPGFSGSSSACQLSGAGAGVASVGVQASGIGEEYNLSARSYNVSGQSSYVSAEGSNMTGGSSRTVKVVSQSDVDKAIEGLGDGEEAEAKSALQAAFGEDDVIITDSYAVNRANPVATPAVDQEASGEAKVVVKVTYRLTGVAKSEIAKYLDAYTKKEVENDSSQRVYNNGSENIFFANYVKNESGESIKLTATAQVGPNIKDDEVKELAKGRNYGDIQSEIESIDGVDSVDVKFWPFWVSTVPDNSDKIKVEFKLDSNGE